MSQTKITSSAASKKSVSRKSTAPTESIAETAAEEPPRQPDLNATVTLQEPLPEGAVPLFLSTATGDLFGLQERFADAETTHTLLSKQAIQADMFNRAAVSDFAPFKQQLASYAGTQVLLIKDAEWRFGQNYILCITQEAFDAYLKPAIVAVDAAIASDTAVGTTDTHAVEENKAPARPRGWTSLGSDIEIDNETVKNTRELIYLKASRRRRKFGLPLHFSDRDAHDSCVDYKTPRDSTIEDLHRMQCDIGIQILQPMSDIAVQTSWFRSANMAIQYEPRTISEAEQDEAMASDKIEKLLEGCLKVCQTALLQNTVMNIFRNEYLALAEEDPAVGHSATSALLEYQSFADLRHSRDKSISCIAWHPTQRGLLAVSCVQRCTLDERLTRGTDTTTPQSLLLVWSFYDPIHPQLVIDAPDEVTSFAFCPTSPNILVGGCVNGQVVLWDLTAFQDKLQGVTKHAAEGSERSNKDKQPGAAVAHYTAVSSIEYSHRVSINDITWLPRGIELGVNGEMVESPDKNNIWQFASAALDGNVFFWDLRYRKDLKGLDLVWRPFLKVPLVSLDTASDYGLTKISLHPLTTEKDRDQPIPSQTKSNTTTIKEKDKEKEKEKKRPLYSRLVCATEEGDVLQADWLTEKIQDDKAAGDKQSSRVESAFSVHFAPVCDVQRSPFFPDIVLTVGGWSFHIWKEKLTSGYLTSSPVSSIYLTGGLWSPTRPGVFFISKADGVIEIWDIMDRSHVPSHIQSLSSTAITSMTINTQFQKGRVHHQFFAVGDDEGTLHVLEVPRTLYRAAKNEPSIVRAFFDREIRRVESVHERKITGAREQAKNDTAAVAVEASRDAAASSAVERKGEVDADDEALEKRYLALEMSIMESLQMTAEI